MKIAFIEKDFNPEHLHVIRLCVTIIKDYESQGYRLTLRQLYYQLIAKEALPDSWRDPVTKSKNNERSYKKLGGIISDARMAGLIDWEMIEDRGRSTSSPSHWDTPRQLLEAAARAFKRDKWRVQPNYVEVMVEKQALEGVLDPICEELGIPFTANKGYSSASAMFEAGQRLRDQFVRRALKRGLLTNLQAQEADIMDELSRELSDKKFDRLFNERFSSEERAMWSLSERAIEDGWPRIGIIYFGDHDPSGIDMTRDVDERLSLFSHGVPIEIHRCALNMAQIEELNPPENPAKETDSRAAGYIARFGNSSWELDAVEPKALAALVEEKVAEFRDDTLWARCVKEETAERAKAMKAISTLKD